MRRLFGGWVILLLVAACDGSTEGGGSAGGTGGNAQANGGGGAAAQPGGGNGTSPGGGGAGGASGVALDPAVLGVWYYGWSGDNLSAFQLALCSNRRARFLFAQEPSDPDPVRAEGSYAATSPTALTVAFDPPQHPLVAELEYDAARDRLVRVGANDGYDPYGINLQRAGITWVTPVLGCE